MKIRMMGIGVLAVVLACGMVQCGFAATGPLADDLPVAGPARMLLGGQLGRLLELRSELDVTAEQRSQIRAIVKSHRQELSEVLRPVVEKRRALRDATLADDADQATIRAAANELGKAIGDAAVVGSQIKAEVKKVLTEEQRGKISEFQGESQSAVDRFLDKMSDAE